MHAGGTAHEERRRASSSSSPAAPGFSARICATRCSREGAQVVCLDNFQTGRRSNLAPSRARAALRPHRGATSSSRCRRSCRPRVDRDLQSRLRRLAAALPGRSRAHAADQRARHAQPPARSPRRAAPGSSWPRPARSMAIPRSTRRPRATGATSTRPARAPATTRASARPRPCPSTSTAPDGADVRVARIFNTYGPRMRADDGRVVSNVICQALARRATSPSTATAARPAPSAT